MDCMLVCFQELGKLRQDSHFLRAKLKKADQELEEIKAANITMREERERLRRKVREHTTQEIVRYLTDFW